MHSFSQVRPYSWISSAPRPSTLEREDREKERRGRRENRATNCPGYRVLLYVHTTNTYLVRDSAIGVFVILFKRIPPNERTNWLVQADYTIDRHFISVIPHLRTTIYVLIRRQEREIRIQMQTKHERIINGKMCRVPAFGIAQVEGTDRLDFVHTFTMFFRGIFLNIFIILIETPNDN